MTNSTNEPIVRTAFTIHIRPDQLDAYVASHAAVWPEMLDALKRSGIRNFSMFLDGTTAFGYYETDDLAKSTAAMEAEPVNARWQKEMTKYISDTITGVGPSDLPQIFRLD